MPVSASNPSRRETERATSRSWTQTFQSPCTIRTQLSGILFTSLLVVCLVFPVGFWSNSRDAIQADESRRNQPKSPATRVSTQSDTINTADTINVADAKDADAVKAVAASEVAVDVHADSLQKTVAPVVEALEKLTGKISVAVIVDGKQRREKVALPLNGGTVDQALAGMGITLSPLDRVKPLRATRAEDGMTIQVTRVRAETQKRREYVQPELRYKLTPKISAGDKQTVEKGKPGVIEITERVWSVDGKVTKREFVSRRVAQPVQDKIIALGSRSYYMPGRIPYHNRYARAYTLSARSGSPRDRLMAGAKATAEPHTFRATKCITLVATGYSPDPRENGGYTTTATGLPIGYGGAAVDPRVIPLGTKLYVEGYGYAFACDTGGAIKGNRIDLAYDSYRLANTKGRKKVRVWILER